VNSPLGNNYHHGDQVESGNFAFTAVESGDHTICFWAPEHKPPTTVTIEFDWRTGMATTDWSNVAKKGYIEEKGRKLRFCFDVDIFIPFNIMELELKKLYASVTSIHDEMFHLRE
ncbi:transmembrane emp24 domain-containing protein p24delta7-like, partial [Morus notabilis]|uniref:transmembrane emp24 domain-containing protein p24delta7-like n=1 Tax=Morus notabilis TaxID=981085 RepID=UPI000CED73E8